MSTGESRLVRVMRKSVPELDSVSEEYVRERIAGYERQLSRAEIIASRHQLLRRIAECRAALEPDFANTKVHHRSNCWYVDRYEEGRFGGRRQFVLVALADLPDYVVACQYCESGRPTPTRGPSGARHSRNIGPTLGDPVGAGPEERADTVRFGRTVRVVDNGSDALHTWTIVSSTEANAGSGKLSAESPIAKALLGHILGETVTVETPRGPRQLTIQDLLP